MKLEMVLKFLETIENFPERLDETGNILEILEKPKYSISSKEKWKLLSILLALFGANIDTNTNEIILHWGVEDEDYFKFLQTIINTITGTNSKGFYYESEGVWKIRYG